jgi:uncharacterized 2Fe-2S/4Fe-4S cluster protein (DUF4445 family)
MSSNHSNKSPSAATVVFLPSGRRGKFPTGITLLEAARQLGEPIESICGGHVACGKCQVRIETGKFPKLGIESHQSHVTPLTDKEKEWLQIAKADAQGMGQLRLSCNARLLDDVVVFVPEHARTRQQTIRKDATMRPVSVKPAIRQVYVELEPPSLDDRRGDWERLQDGLRNQWGFDNLEIAFPALRTLSQELRQGKWKATVILWRERRVIEVRSGYQEGIWGLAVDIGSTTIVAHLSDLQTGELLATQAVMNPQVTYGEDLMSRISYAIDNKDGLKKLHRAVLGAFNRLAQSVAEAAGIKSKDIHEAVVVGNTTMISLFLNINPENLGMVPFIMANRDEMDIPACELKLRLHPAANVHILPAVAGHVGADNVSVMVAEEPFRQDAVTLIVDVGTNAEIALWNGQRLYNASSPTGPAFEGAQISHGMRAAPGAIERVRIDRQTKEVRYKIIGEERWNDEWTPENPPALSPTGICGSGIIEAVAEMYLAGILLPDGRFNPELQHPRLSWDGKKGAFVLATVEETATGRAIPVTQDDVRAIQLAKAALYAGSKLLMREAGVDRVDRIVLAGAFGSYIDPFHAMALGLIPDADLDQVYAVGNAAGDGALISLLNVERRDEAQWIARSSTYVETAANMFFQEAFVSAIHLPHQTDAFPHIAKWLPEPPKIAASNRSPRARRARRAARTAGGE